MVDPYKGTRFEGFTGLGNDGYGSRSQGPMDNILADGFFVNDPRRPGPGPGLGPRPGMRGSSDSGIPAIPNPASDINSSLKALGMTPPTQDPDKADFYAFKKTLRDPGDMGRYLAAGEDISYEDFVKFGRPANLAAAESAGYGGGALLGDGFGNKVSLGFLVDNANLKDATGMPDFRGPVDPFARPTPGMLGPTTEVNPTAEPPTSPQPDVTKPPMPTGGLAGLTQLPMFQDFATKLEAEHPEASQLFSQMFMGSSQRPMPYQNPFMGMGMGSFHPMMGMGMGGYNPMMGGMGGGFNPMMGGMGMGGYSPFMGMNPFMGGGFNPMMGMGGGGLGSFYPQPSTYGPPQSMPSMGGYPTPPQSSPFGGAMRGYYA